MKLLKKIASEVSAAIVLWSCVGLLAWTLATIPVEPVTRFVGLIFGSGK